jgi:ATP-dependent DNA ligase
LFDRVRYRRHAGVFLYAFDLIELDGDDLRRAPLAGRKATLASLLSPASRRGCVSTSTWTTQTARSYSRTPARWFEGIVSKRRNSTYRSGRSPDWIKSKNPAAPAVKREAEEDWGGWSATSKYSRR